MDENMEQSLCKQQLHRTLPSQNPSCNLGNLVLTRTCKFLMCDLQIRKIKLNQKLNNLLHFHRNGNQVSLFSISKSSSLDFQLIIH